MNICKVQECKGKVFGHGHCNRHYMQIRKYGRIVAAHGRVPSDSNRFIFDDDIAWMELYDRWGNVTANTIIDAEDYQKAKTKKWHLDGKGYVCSKENNNKLFLHHLITDYGKYRVDHKDRNPLNNRKSNLRECTRSQNSMNRECKGIAWKRGKWQSMIMKNGQSHYLGRFDKMKDAILVYNKAAKELHGEFACLNKVAE